MGVIYILTNPSFPEYVKIGYADDVEKRLRDLNRSECIPYAFRVYATFEVETRLTDIKVHELIDQLNPNLRAIEVCNGKKRTKEFFAMTPEDAYKILDAIASINNRKDKLKLWKITKEEAADEQTAELIEIESRQRNHAEPISLEEYLKNKDKKLVEIYRALQADVYENFENASIYVLPQYIGWRKGDNYFAEIHIQKKAIQFLTLPPKSECTIGKRVPDNFLWTLCFRSYIDDIDQLEEAETVLRESFEQR